jgi:hypothetical protein
VHASGMDRVPAVAAALHVLRETATAAHTGP